MKVYLSADMEGITGTTTWDDVEENKAGYPKYRQQMTAEVAAACEGFLAAGAKEVWVQDAHDTGRNLLHEQLPREVRLVNGWSGHPFGMVQELNETFDALSMVGYHARAGSHENPLAHTWNPTIHTIRINDRLTSEFLLCAYTAALKDVPVVFLTGDSAVCEEARLLNENIATVAVKEGKGGSTVNIHPGIACDRIREASREALDRDLGPCRIGLPGTFRLEVRYQSPRRAYRASLYPGARLSDPHTATFETDDFFEIMRATTFIL